MCLLSVSDLTNLYQLNSIDNMRVEGKFFIGKDLPEGQGSVNALLAECYDICYDLRAQKEGEGDNAPE